MNLFPVVPTCLSFLVALCSPALLVSHCCLIPCQRFGKTMKFFGIKQAIDKALFRDLQRREHEKEREREKGEKKIFN